MYFFDTNVFIHATNKTSELFNRCNTIISEENWLTSNIVVNELKNVYKRRNQIYLNLGEVISNNYKDFDDKCTNDFYRKCLKSSLGSNKNDCKHIDELYYSSLEETKLKDTDILNRKKLEEIVSTLGFKLFDIRTRFFKMVSLFNSAEFYDKHVVPAGICDTLSKSLKNKLYKLDYAKRNKQDLNIVVDASIYSNSQSINLDIITSDRYLLENASSIESIIKMGCTQSQIKIIQIPPQIR